MMLTKTAARGKEGAEYIAVAYDDIVNPKKKEKHTESAEAEAEKTLARIGIKVIKDGRI